MLCAILRDEGYAVVGEMASGENFLFTVEYLKPDIICLDQELPETDGLALLQQLKEKGIQTAIVMISGAIDPAIRQKAVEVGVAGFLTKPFSQIQITAELKQVDHARKLLAESGGVKNAQALSVNIVLADDSSVMRALLSAILKNMGLNVVGEARTGNEAISMTAQHHPQLVCLDLEMPDTDGLEALRQIKKNHPEIKVIIVSGLAERDKVRRAIELGASSYILKPYETQQVVNVIKKLLPK
jgi:two-component system chemotaxis response regulator CheY